MQLQLNRARLGTVPQKSSAHFATESHGVPGSAAASRGGSSGLHHVDAAEGETDVTAHRFITTTLLASCLIALAAQEAQAQPGGLKFFKNYLLTGGHFAAGVALKGTGDSNGNATGFITINEDASGITGVPADADIVAAYLYWETVTTTGGSGATGISFNTIPVDPAAKLLNPSGSSPCWSNGGATGGGGNLKMKVYRIDALPFLPRVDGKPVAIGTHQVVLPDAGSTGNVVPSTAGATLFLVFRKVGWPLSATVVYDGGFTLNQSNQLFSQTLKGWYQASLSNPSAYMTHAVGNGQSNFGELLKFKDQNDVTLDTIANPFVGPSWDTYRAPVSLPSGSSTAKMTVERGASPGPFDCLSWGMVALTTRVEDSDPGGGDGIIDALEDAQSSGTFTDPNGEPLPDLYAMGARKTIKDVFLEFGFMKSTAGYTNPQQTVNPNHTHLPSRDALNMLAKAFRFAPLERINLHFDIGNNYQDGALPPGGWNSCPTANATDWTPNCAIIRTYKAGTENTQNPVPLADGGEFIEETPCVPSTPGSCLFQSYPGPLTCDVLVTCQFSGYPGTVGWKSGFREYRDEPLLPYRVVVNGADAGPDEAGCAAAEGDLDVNNVPITSTTCKRRFARTRKDIFHYTLLAHALGLAKSNDPNSPLYNVPRSISGIGDFLGGDIMMTLGFYDGATGTPFVQASTLMHELGHNFGRRHGGITGEPNCKPNYQSVMNYLFQIRGLINKFGVAEIGYSRQLLPLLDEGALIEGQGIPAPAPDTEMDWRTRWYVPWQDSFIDTALNTTPTYRRCNGAGEVLTPMARIDGTTVSGPIDWNVNGVIDAGAVQRDLNFSAPVVAPFFDQLAAATSDWAGLQLHQVGARRVGVWSLGASKWDAGEDGYWDAGDDGYWDAGDDGYWDAGDDGYWDAGDDDPDNQDEPDLDDFTSLGNSPNSLSACKTANGVSCTTGNAKDFLVTFQPPHVRRNDVAFYELYRLEGTAVTPANLAQRVPITNPIYPSAPGAAVSVIDTTSKNNTTYIYIVLAQFNLRPGDLEPQRSGIGVSLPVSK